MADLNVAIVENEEEEAFKSKELILSYGKERGIGIDISIFSDAVHFLKDSPNQIDCIFLDIDMPGINGMDMAVEVRKINKKVDIVFVTNLPQFAIDGYKVQALDFVLKPTNYSDFRMALDKIYEKKSKEIKDGFVLKAGATVQCFKNKEVVYIEMKRHDLFVYMDDGAIFSTRGTIKALEEELNKDMFAKINSGIIVNLGKVARLENNSVIMQDKTDLPISRSHKKEFAIRLSDFYGNHLEER